MGCWGKGGLQDPSVSTLIWFPTRPLRILVVAAGTVIEHSSFDLEMVSLMPDTWPLMEPKDGGAPGDVDLRGGGGEFLSAGWTFSPL